MAFNVKFGATDAGFTSTVKKINESTKGMGRNVKDVSGSVKTSFAGMMKAGAALGAGFFAIRTDKCKSNKFYLIFDLLLTMLAYHPCPHCFTYIR